MSSFAENYPHLAWWVENHGWLELGSDEYSSSLLRLLDEGGTCFEDEESEALDDALTAGESFLTTELPERFGLERDPETGGV